MRSCSEACERNREPILAVLREVFADRRKVLEIGSGSGQHAVHFAAGLPHLAWQPSDLPEHLPGIRLWCDEAGLANLLAPIVLDLNQDPWPDAHADAVFSANTLHIVSWSEVQTLFERIGPMLPSSGVLALYGPFAYGGRHTSQSNAHFDLLLRERDPRSGIRDFQDVDPLARAAGLRLVRDVAMPANNRTLVWRRAPASQDSVAVDARGGIGAANRSLARAPARDHEDDCGETPAARPPAHLWILADGHPAAGRPWPQFTGPRGAC